MAKSFTYSILNSFAYPVTEMECTLTLIIQFFLTFHLTDEGRQSTILIKSGKADNILIFHIHN